VGQVGTNSETTLGITRFQLEIRAFARRDNGWQSPTRTGRQPGMRYRDARAAQGRQIGAAVEKALSH
jgi:hypothetical protein